MNKSGWALLAVLLSAAPATAQNQPVAIPARDFGPVWTGFYVGAAFGAGGAVNRLELIDSGAQHYL